MDLARCPACRAAVRPDADWCSLCYRDLRPAPMVTPPVPITHVTPAVPSPQTPPAPADAKSQGWPCVTCGAAVPFEAEACPSCGMSFRSAMRGDSGRHRAAASGTRPGAVGGREVTRPVRLAVGTLAGILLAVIIPVLLALLG